jgi:hypothetical protein
LLELFKQPIVFEGWWENVMAQFGTPQIYNSKQEPSFRAPLELQELEPLIQPIWLSTIQQIHHTLLGGRRRCTLYDVCDRSKNGLKTDERCHYAPWVRASDQLTCAYGSLWVNYGLADKIVL